MAPLSRLRVHALPVATTFHPTSWLGASLGTSSELTSFIRTASLVLAPRVIRMEAISRFWALGQALSRELRQCETVFRTTLRLNFRQMSQQAEHLFF
jgi:hypothetical protein